MTKTIIPISLLALSFSLQSSMAITLITGDSNSVDITEITYTRNGSDFTQSSSATTITATNDSIFLKNTKINDNGTIKDLKFHNIGGTISNVNLTSAANGVGVVKNGVRTDISDGVAPYVEVLTGILNDVDINNYAYYDNIELGNLPNAGVPDFDIRFSYPFKLGDYIAVTERNGNTYFNLTALDINGNVISDAQILQFNSSTGSLNTSGEPGGYDWNLGFTSASYFSAQPQWMTIAKVELFDTNTEVYGFRIDNNGEADIKFFGLSQTSFVPEPSSAALLGLATLVFLARRKRS